MFYVTFYGDDEEQALLYYKECWDDAKAFCEEQFKDIYYTIDEFEDEELEEAKQFMREELQFQKEREEARLSQFSNKRFSTKEQCDKCIKTHGLKAISTPKHSEDDGALLYWHILYI